MCKSRCVRVLYVCDGRWESGEQNHSSNSMKTPVVIKHLESHIVSKLYDF